MTLKDIKVALRGGQYAWPGGYQQFFITADGAALSFDAVRDQWREVVKAHLTANRRCGWFLEGVDVNWEDETLTCEHTGQPIPAAYSDDPPEHPLRTAIREINERHS